MTVNEIIEYMDNNYSNYYFTVDDLKAIVNHSLSLSEIETISKEIEQQSPYKLVK